ncbi:DUF3152 domain-containing protein [Streptomyces aureocirculatus]|uniref:DUF3152 domain-containing protein n=1 Tax=Streptomyces aureocirculatus TaxID=67275 RepID=UPI0004CB9F67|nr:DUF3152 domain-containing protein [Streptomyces aureocirculatus]
MGRHSRHRGPADTSDTTSTSGIQSGAPKAQAKGPTPGSGRRRRGGGGGTPPHGVPQVPPPSTTTPPHGVPQHTPPHGVPQHTPPHGVPQHTPPHGVPQHTPPGGTPQVRGGHPEQREPGGGWGEVGGAAAGVGHGVPPQVRGTSAQGPRQDYVDAFGADEMIDVHDDVHDDGLGDGVDDVFAAGTKTAARPPRHRDPYASVTTWDSGGSDGGGHDGTGDGDGGDGDPEPAGDGDPGSGSGTASGREKNRGRTVTGIAAAAVTTLLAVVVAGQVADGAKGDGSPTQAAEQGGNRDGQDSEASRSDNRPAPSDPTPAPAAPATYDEKMGKKYPLDAKLTASGDFDVVRGFARAPGKGQKFRYRVDVEKGMALDGGLFAEAVQKTLNDDRSWAHGGARTFERISSGHPDFVITLASPGTTAKWCAKSGLDTWEQNVSCDSAATDRVMINAFRWAQGAKTYGDRIHPYRQMLINHEVGHRLGYGHVDCRRDGELAPVMQQQTKFLNHDGIRCKANPWSFPKS